MPPQNPLLLMINCQLLAAGIFWAEYSYISEWVMQLFALSTNPAAHLHLIYTPEKNLFNDKVWTIYFLSLLFSDLITATWANG